MTRAAIATTTWALGLLATSTALAAAGPMSPTARPALPLDALLSHSDFVPNRAAYARADARALEVPPVVHAATGGVTLIDEIVVMEGDDELVTSFGGGQYGLRFDNQRQDPIRVVQRFLDHHPDDFDFIVVWTTFWDYGAEGLAYYVGVRQTTKGIGQPGMDAGWTWGSKPGGRLQGFLNMKSIGLYGNIGDPENFAYPVMGQEMTHRWLAFMRHVDASGQVSDAMLGRDEAHWSSLLQADGSVQDGNWWKDNADGTFRNLGTMLGFSPLDLYGMGLYGADEVEPWFLITDATYNGQALNGLMQLPVGTTVSGTRKDITIEQVLAAHGTRDPDVTTSRKAFRVATLLVTRPGETAAQAGQEIASITTFNALWAETFEAWTHGRAAVCMRVSADCDAPALRLLDATAREGQGDGDGMPEPGETVLIDLAVANPGTVATAAVSASLAVPEGSDLSLAAPTAALGPLAPGAQVAAVAAFEVAVGPDAPCGEEAVLDVTLTDGALETVGRIRVPIGFRDAFVDDFAADQGWVVDPDGTDTAVNGAWERAAPVGVDAAQLGVELQTQPARDRQGTGAAFITGPLGGGLGDHDVDDGVTTLQSPPLPAADLPDPHLSYWTWRVGYDFNDPSGYITPEPNDALTVELSPDGGATWILVEDDRANTQQWTQKTVRVLDLVDAVPEAIVLRFTARDVAPQSLSEAGVDDVRLFDFQPSCYGLVEEPETPGEGGGETPGEGGGETPGEGGEAPGETDPLPVDGDEVTLLVDGERKASGGCAGGGGAWAWSLAGLALVGLRRRRRGAR